MKTMIKSLARMAGYEIARARKAGDQYLSLGQRFPHDFTEAEIELILRAKPFTMTSPERVVTLIHAIEYIASREIAGDIVECGVWRGGSMMIAAWTLLRLNRGDIPLRLFDTFAGMSQPSAVDGEAANQTWRDGWAKNHNNACFATLEEVRANLYSTGYEPDRISFVQGDVLETIPQFAPERIALLRLDTDWYESTKHELWHLYPRIVPGGVLLIDDYGHWQGCRKAVDEYFNTQKIQVLLNRIDVTGRIAVKH